MASTSNSSSSEISRNYWPLFKASSSTKLSTLKPSCVGVETPNYFSLNLLKACMNRHLRWKLRLSVKSSKYLFIAINIIIKEAIMRAKVQAFAEDSNTVSADILSKVIPQLMLDV